ncbi:unnamed protein product [Symbiodinium natans]|uniref:Uncharacterized protein n=1 Tax=Symbiodinium natans TaxID=878477 RepID=A0A812S5K7_9DINO|nr:unnamed protein product [Symbiodinium natans]
MLALMRRGRPTESWQQSITPTWTRLRKPRTCFRKLSVLWPSLPARTRIWMRPRC